MLTLFNRNEVEKALTNATETHVFLSNENIKIKQELIYFQKEKIKLEAELRQLEKFDLNHQFIFDC